MAEMKQSATQRIQVGIIGLVVVLLFVSLANMALDRASNEPPASQIPAGMSAQSTVSGDEAAPGEPLAELGVTPVPKDEPLPGAPDQNTSNVRAAPSKRQNQ